LGFHLPEFAVGDRSCHPNFAIGKPWLCSELSCQFGSTPPLVQWATWTSHRWFYRAFLSVCGDCLVTGMADQRYCLFDAVVATRDSGRQPMASRSFFVVSWLGVYHPLGGNARWTSASFFVACTYSIHEYDLAAYHLASH
jgi:hypothetical protein